MTNRLRRITLIYLLPLLFFLLPAQASSQETVRPGDGAPEAGVLRESAGPSAFEAYASETVRPLFAEPQSLRQFGYDIFSRRADFDPTQLMPVGPDYLLGPGDELNVSIWGKVNASMSVRIDRDGKVSLGEFGAIHLAGLTFSEAKDYLLRELARYYKTSEVRMNVSLGALSSMRVFVVGKAASPGSHTVSSMSTLVNALIAAGGPGKNGSLRSIKVTRGARTVTVFDAYDLLLKGDKSRDVRLMPDDVVLIPPVGPLVAVSGSVKAPGVYELNGEQNLAEVLALAGGRSDLAFSGRVRIDRVTDDGRIVAIEAALEGSDAMEVRPGDVVSVFEAVPDKKVVRLAGAVERGGMYALGRDLTISHLIGLSGGLKPYAYGRQAELTRVTPTPDGPVTKKIYIDLERAMAKDPGHDLSLVDNDYLFVRTVPEWELYRTVSIRGEVRFPGTYTIEKGEKISSLVERAGGFTEKAYLKGAMFTRVAVRAQQQQQIDDMARRLEFELLGSAAETTEAALDPQAAAQLKIAAEQKKLLVAKIRAARASGRISIALEPFDAFKGSSYDIALEEGDELTVPENPAQVQVIGSVYNQTSFIHSSDSTVSDYLRKAGGFTRNADKGEMYILKVDGTAVSKRSSSGWLGGFSSKNLDPGDTIVVPEKVEKVVWLREVKDITQILYQIAVTAGVLIVAF